ncbi:MAG: tripartite tricarboxylate transporter substrate binding protein [Candidatus Protistobacter heckmanni]|nr:tripartite tricarboxylate transporter substrate binding protein [Candidatus Protistobacter heckmanni]
MRWPPSPALAQAYPSKPVTIVVPFPAGGPTDASARLVGTVLAAKLGQPVVIDNRAGAGGTVGSASVARVPADGYTLLWGGTSSLAVAPALYKTLKYDPLKSFVPVGIAVRSPLLLAGSTGLKPATLKELAAYAKTAKPTVGSAGNGSVGHLASLYLSEAGQFEMLHVPYKGGAPALTDLLGGQIDLMFDTAQYLYPKVKEGKIRAYATTSAKRYAMLPDVPTMVEIFGKSFEAYSWFGLVAPADTPKAVIHMLSEALLKAMDDPEVKRQLAATGMEPVNSSPEQFGKTIQADLQKWTGLVQHGNIRPEE